MEAKFFVAFCSGIGQQTTHWEYQYLTLYLIHSISPVSHLQHIFMKWKDILITQYQENSMHNSRGISTRQALSS